MEGIEGEMPCQNPTGHSAGFPEGRERQFGEDRASRKQELLSKGSKPVGLCSTALLQCVT